MQLSSSYKRNVAIYLCPGICHGFVADYFVILLSFAAHERG